MSNTDDLPGQPTTSQQPPPTHTPIKPRTLILVILFTAIVVGTGGYFLGSRSQQANPSHLSSQPTMTGNFSQNKEIPVSPTSLTTTANKEQEVLPTISSGASIPGCLADSTGWKHYSDPSNRFLIDYPKMMQPHVTALGKESEPLVIQTQFSFEEPFYKGTAAEPFGLYFWIFAKQNPKRLTPEEWEKLTGNPNAISSPMRPISIAGREGVIFHLDDPGGLNRANILVAGKDLMYQLDIADTPEGTGSDIQACWSSIYNKMLGSFTLP